MTEQPYSIPRFVAMMLLAFAGLAACVHFLNESSIQSITRAQALSSAEHLSRRIATEVADLENILAGQNPSNQSQQQLRAVAMTEDMVKFNLYNKQGDSVLRLDKSGQDPNPNTPLKHHNPDVLEALTDGQAKSVIKEATNDGTSGSDVLVEAYVPVVQAGRTLGIISVYVDQTQLDSRLRSQLSRQNLLIVAFSLLGFAVPAIGVFLRTRQKQIADKKIAYLAQFDVLTNLLNRKTFESNLSECLLESGKANKRVALHFLDLDFFKAINDNFGHAFGDELLKQFSARLKENLRPGDIAARFGGDEFVIAQTGLDSIEDLADATRKLYGNMILPLQIMGKNLIPSVSMGTAMYPENGIDTSILLHCADIALYVVKGQGRNGHRFFEPSYNQARLRRTDLEFLVRKNVVSRNFELAYQPYYSLKTGRLEGFEALLRMRDTHGNFVSPAEFVPVAEDLGLISEIGAWVLNTACSFAKDWPSDVKLSVNLSSVQFKKKTACPSVLQALKDSGLDPSRLVLEITESVLLADVDDVRQQIQVLNSYGAELAMDDFGTGYSSLSYILRLQFDRLKIDRSFITQMSSGDESARKIVETIISLGHTMKMLVTAEGVETEEQAFMLQAMGCDQVQGFLFSKPVEPAQVSNLIMKAFVNTELSGHHELDHSVGGSTVLHDVREASQASA